MCGVAGCFGSTDVDAVKRMLSAQSHRGPDGQGIWVDAAGGNVLGHRRLAVLDTTPAGAQPMHDATGRLHLTFNGEIYNFRELRGELAQRGYHFTTGTDTEVVLAAYHAWGPEALKRLTGMFAFAVIDDAPPAGWPEKLLARDRLGIKPLLYARQGRSMWFASELKALRASKKLEGGVSVDALADYLAIGAAQQPTTFIQGVVALPAGHYLHITAGSERCVRYWDLHSATKSLRQELSTISFADACTQVRSHLEDAARCHLIADVPTGTFLSGGLDSAAVAALTARAGRQIKTFSIGFESFYGTGTGDELSAARASARFLGSDHHEYVVPDALAGHVFQSVLESIDQPSVDGTNTWLASRLARTQVTVALSGLGSDEVFAGYPHFLWGDPQTPKRPHGRSAKQWCLEQAWGTMPHWRLAKAIARNADIVHRAALLRRVLTDDMAAWTTQRWLAQPIKDGSRGRFSKFALEEGDLTQRMSYLEVRMYLQNTLLRDADVMSMVHGLELRPMFLHHPLVEFGYALPARIKIRNQRGKDVLYHALQDILPPHLQHAPKRGFNLPLRRWTRHASLRPRIRDLLHGANARRLFTRSYRHAIEARLLFGHPPRSTWGWGTLLGWLEHSGLQL